MIRVICLDDEDLNLKYLKSILVKNQDIEILGLFTEPLKAIEFIQSNEIDIAFLDIELPDMSGLECAVKIQDIQESVEIVFVTAYSHYAIEAFNLHALHYLLKPIKQEQVIQLIEHLKRIQPKFISSNITQNKTFVSFFGKFKLLNPLNEEIKWPTKKTAELCAYFILNANQKLSKYRICEDLWPDYDEEKASQNFHITLYRLRNLITNEKIQIKIEALRGSNDGYICECFGLKSDYDEIMLVMSLKEKSFDRIFELFERLKGSFLENNYYLWSESIKSEMESQIINRIHQIVREFEMINRDKAIVLVKQALKVFRLDESLMMHYFNLLFRKNEIYTILHEYELYKKSLYNEYSIRPSEEITSFIKKLV